MGASDKVCLHGWGVFGCADVIWDPGGDLVLTMEQGGSGARDPRGEQAGTEWTFGVDCISLLVGKYIDLRIWG